MYRHPYNVLTYTNFCRVLTLVNFHFCPQHTTRWNVFVISRLEKVSSTCPFSGEVVQDSSETEKPYLPCLYTWDVQNLQGTKGTSNTRNQSTWWISQKGRKVLLTTLVISLKPLALLFTLRSSTGYLGSNTAVLEGGKLRRPDSTTDLRLPKEQRGLHVRRNLFLPLFPCFICPPGHFTYPRSAVWG